MKFNFNNYEENYEFYHVKYGRGAVILAVPKDKAPFENAKKYNRRDVNDHYSEPVLNKVKFINEEDDFISADIYLDGDRGSYMTRKIPFNQVTFEIY